MAKKPRNWTKLAASTRKRYEAYGRKTGVDAKTYYESGASMQAARGHTPPAGVSSERAWTKARKQLIANVQGFVFGQYNAKTRKVEARTADQAIRSARTQGMSQAAIARQLEARKRATDAYRGGDKTVGQQAWARRKKLSGAATSLWWYH